MTSNVKSYSDKPCSIIILAPDIPSISQERDETFNDLSMSLTRKGVKDMVPFRRHDNGNTRMTVQS